MNTIHSKQIHISELISEFINLDPQFDRLITGIAIDSRKINNGDLFIAYPGEAVDGREFIQAAIAKGAVAVLAENENAAIIFYENVPIIQLPNLREKTGNIAAKFYGNPASKLTVVGITGTSGKTSCAYFLASALTSLGKKCGYIGTIGAGFPDQLQPLINTTPDPVTLQKILFEFLQNDAEAVAMEVSSIGLVQGRMHGVDFKIAVFTNLSRDHLDYHKDMESYGAAKKILFQLPKLKYAVINSDDPFGKTLLQQLSGNLQLFSYSLGGDSKNHPTKNSVMASRIKLGLHGIKADVISPWGEGTLKSELLGRFNLSNLLVVLSVLGIMQIPLQNALQAMAKLTTVAGRMQTLGGNKKPLVVIDYAHKPDALEQVLLTLREHCTGKLWCVFGCGGDRDRGKRPMMGQIAERLSDHLIITNDNPRTENPEQIVNDILQGLLCPWAAEVEYDRRAAIAHAINCAQPNDIILIAGKGHEDYQIIGKEKSHFSDYEEAEKQLGIK